jgi:maleylpyruvate isomerase
VRIVLEVKGIAYEYRPVDLLKDHGEQHSDAYREINPLSQVPALETRDAAGRSVHIGQSLAIAEYLEEAFPEPRLLPSDALARAKTRQIAETINAGIQPFATSRALRYVGEHMQADRAAWARHWLASGLAALEVMVRASAGRFSVGDALTLADACLVPQLYHALRFGVLLGEFETLLRVERECSQLDAFARAHAERQPDAPAPALTC